MDKTILDSNFKEVLLEFFSSIDYKNTGHIEIDFLIKYFNDLGFDKKNPLTKNVLISLLKLKDKTIVFDDFYCLFSKCNKTFYTKIFNNELKIKNFDNFKSIVTNIYNDVYDDNKGSVANYIAELAKVDSNQFAVSVCTIDGQQFSMGDSSSSFSMQSMIKPILYLLALDENGEKKVHKHIGREPSGHNFNELTLNNIGLPHNPMINAGAIMACSLIKPKLNPANRFNSLVSAVKKLSANSVSFNNTVYHSEKDSSDRNFALSYFMREKKAFPKNTNLMNTLDLYFQACSIETNTSSLSVLAATLANGGVCPITFEQVFSTDQIKHCLSLMYSCGMYDYSGEWAFTIGLPAKSGVSGGIYLVIPNVMGICIWSPKIDSLGNSYRGIEFCKKLIQMYTVNSHDNVSMLNNNVNNLTKLDKYLLFEAVYNNNLDQIISLYLKGVDINSQYHDMRTALHIAASEGYDGIVEYLLSKGAKADIKDKWDKTPLDNAHEFKHGAVVDVLLKVQS